MPVKFLISVLRKGIDPGAYERWVRERDYPFVASKPNFLSYKVHRVSGAIAGADSAEWAYIERIEVGSLEQHQADMATPEGMKIREELFSYIDRERCISFASDEV